jgi:acetyl-CoA carboxylase biotin carboxyl carrier protein
MNLKEIKELFEFLKDQDIAEFELARGDVKIRIKRNVPGAATAASYGSLHAPPEAEVVPPAVPIPSTAAPAVAPPEDLHLMHSPIVGTFYEAPSPGAPPFVKVGDLVSVGQVLCIVEAMKLMNEIESDVAGEIVKKLVTNGQPIEYGQELFAIRARK